MSLRGNFRWWYWRAVYQSRRGLRATWRWLGQRLEDALPHLAAMGGVTYSLAPPAHSTASSDPTGRRDEHAV